ncbi:MAG: hypothetical protein ACHREM_02015 [Polyangiales bacterium]
MPSSVAPPPTPSLPPRAPHIARWDLDKTYLRTEFDTVRDLVKTALERADQKRAHPGASALMRELQVAGAEIHILSGSPEQMRRRLSQKLALDGVRFASLTLKSNLRNILKMRLRSVRGQLGYKLPTLLTMRAKIDTGAGATTILPSETLVGDDAEADAFIYALYADVCAGRVDATLVAEVMRLDRCHPEEIADAAHAAQLLRVAIDSFGTTEEAVERVLIHLDQQTPPSDFDVFGARIVPFYNYFQAALVLLGDGRIGGEGALRVGRDLIVQHRFEAEQLLRSGLDLARRGHLSQSAIDRLQRAADRLPEATDPMHLLGRRAAELTAARKAPRTDKVSVPDYVSLVLAHNRRRRK